MLAPRARPNHLDAHGDEEDDDADQDDCGGADEGDERPVGVLAGSEDVDDDEYGEGQQPGDDEGAPDGGERVAVEAAGLWRLGAMRLVAALR